MNQRPPGPVVYVGLVTRAVALIIDALAINLVAALVGGVTTLIASLFGWGSGLNSAEAVAGGVLWWLWITAYFVLFWTLTGQTPGGRLLGFRVVNVSGGGIPARQALRRFGGTILAALPLGAGFLVVLFDDRRRGLHDWIGRTVVRWDTDQVYEAAGAQIAEELMLDRGLHQSPQHTVNPLLTAD